jgi:thiosulfate/3-mercaptopyruvate sulfurtransferase
MNDQALVSVAWLRDRLATPGLVVFDATLYLPTEHKDARALYRRAHIPGARFFDIDALSDPDTSLPHMAPSAERFAAFMQAWGVRDADHVVFYDQKGLFSAARGWWLLRLFGHALVSVLDGGLPAWQRAGGALQSGEVVAMPAGQAYRASYHPQLLRDLAAVLEQVPTRRAVLLDARSRGRFEGTAPEPRPGVARGHIPGSQSLPYETLLNADQSMKSADELRALLRAVGADASRPIITSCGSGVTAAVLSLGLHMAGLPMGGLYDGSWTEWGARADTPKQTGASTAKEGS